MYDCIIIGMGAAGMSAAIYAKNAGMNVLMLEASAPGGILNKVKSVDNYLGFKEISGSDLAYNMFEHIRILNIQYKIDRVLDIKKIDDYILITTSKGEYRTSGVIIASGRKIKRSGIVNENDFVNKGISYCATCDGALYKNKTVCLLGSDEVAFEEVKYLSNIVKKVYFVTNREVSFDISNLSNVELINNIKVEKFLGNENITGIMLENGSVIDTDGVFIYYGYGSEVAFLNNLDICDENGMVVVDDNMKTKCDKIYACGDIIKKELYQVSTAVSEGAIAAVNLNKELNVR